MSSDNENHKVEEPNISFKNIRVYDTFEEMEEDELKWLASLSPEEHLRNTTSLIKRIFSEQLKKYPKIGARLYFD